MSSADPRQVILDQLARPVGRLEPEPSGHGRLQPAVIHGGNAFHADLSTVRFLKYRQSGRRCVYFVTFDGILPQLGTETYIFSYVFPLERDSGGRWHLIGGAGGAGEMPARSAPWVNLGGGGWPDRFYAGGRIDNAGVQLARVELLFRNGIKLEDDCEQGAALFITEQSIEMPATAVLYDRAGNQVATHPAFGAVGSA